MGRSAVAVTAEHHGWRVGEKSSSVREQPRKSPSDGSRNAQRFENHEAWGSRFWGSVYGEGTGPAPPPFAKDAKDGPPAANNGDKDGAPGDRGLRYPCARPSPWSKYMPTVADGSRPSKKKASQTKDSQWLLIFARYGGFPGFVLFIFLTLFSMFGNLKSIFGPLNEQHTYRLIVIFLVLVFTFAVFALACWVYVKTKETGLQKARLGMFLLMVLIVAGIGAAASTGKIKSNVRRSLGTVGPGVSVMSPLSKQFIEDSEWDIDVSLSGGRHFTGQVTLAMNGKYNIHGVIRKLERVNHYICGMSIDGTWSYAQDRSSLKICGQIWL